MSALPLREQFLREIDSLSDEQVESLLQAIRLLRGKPSGEIQPAHKDIEDDPAIGFISGPPDLAERSSEILREELGLRKPWDSEE